MTLLIEDSKKRLTASSISSLSDYERKAFLETLTQEEKAALLYRWAFWARDNQLWPSGDWRVWLILAGRGNGKTRTGAEAVRRVAEGGEVGNIGLIGETAADVRDVMVEGPAGILAVSPPWLMPKYEPSKRRLTWPNGVRATTFSGDDPEQLRGPSHGLVWCDEPAKWRYAQETWDNMEFGLRSGVNPRVIATTTPRPIPLIKALVKDPQTHVTRGTTFENAPNLAEPFLATIRRKYEGTRLGRQELNAEILDDNPRALWQRAQIDNLRVKADDVPDLVRIVVAVDPMSADPSESPELEETGSATGIIVGGVTAGNDCHGFILSDKTLFGTPNQWGLAVVNAFLEAKADRVIAEVNQGGAMVKYVVLTVAADMGLRVPFRAVHASRGKYIRAEPVAALYEQGRVHHVGSFPEMEDELCEWEPGMPSPNRLDALVWALTELMVENVRTIATVA